MAESDVTNRPWLVDLEPDVARLRCSYRRRRKRIVQFTVQIEVFHAGQWRPVVRYDNAHGFCHRDTIHADGTQEKIPVYYGEANETFTRAIDDLRENWRDHCNRFLREAVT
jgi:hypothetical protein